VFETKKEVVLTPEHPLWVQGKGWVKARDLRIDDAVKVFTEIPCLKDNYERLPPPVKIANQGKKISFPEFCDEDFGWIFGYLVGDGSSLKKNYVVVAYFVDDEYDLMELFIAKFAKLFGVQPSKSVRFPKDGMIQGRQIHTTHDITQIVYNSKLLGSLFHMEKQPIRIVPDIILASKKSVIASFLSGLFDADGCIFITTNEDRTPKVRIQLKSSSHRLLQDVQVLLLKFGISARINGDNLIIARCEDCRRFIEQIGFQSQKKKGTQDSISKYCEKRPGERFQLNYENIVQIYENGISDVYDIDVSTDHRFISDGVISHTSE
jgi:intein/homing endonuclease